MITDTDSCDRSNTGTGTSTLPDPSCTSSQELNVMLLHEILARTRMREDQRRASAERLAARLAAVRRWERLARYAERRASRLASRL